MKTACTEAEIESLPGVKLGEGAYGCVYKSKDIGTGQIIAIKVIKITYDDEGIPSTTLREISILKSLDHQNIVKLRHVTLDLMNPSPRVELHFEFMDQDLAKYIRRNKRPDPKDVKKIMKQILLGVRYMHQNKVFHRDLKPQNILINKHTEVKIADFGLGRTIGAQFDTMSKQIETLWYRAPELLFGTTRYDFAVDIWSIGCIFYELAEGKVLFQTQSEIGQIMEIMRQQGTPKLEEWPQVKSYPYFKPTLPKFTKIQKVFKNLCAPGAQLLESCICINPKNRVKIEEAISHPYFDD